MENVELTKCVSCGSSDTVLIEDRDGNFYCEECVGEHCIFCEECHEWVQNGNGDYLTDNGKIICCDCYNDRYFTCNECGGVFEEDEAYCGDNGNFYCVECFNDGFFTCERCGNVYSLEHEYQYEHEGDIYCSECFDELNMQNIYNYHDYPDFVLKKCDDEDEPEFYLGIENEIECYDLDRQQVAKQIYDNLDCYVAKDGSLNNGLEIITHPMSFKYLQEHKDEIKNCFEKLSGEGCKSHDTDTCGLHIHVSRPCEDVVNKIILVMETYKNELIKFSRRSESNLNRWAQFFSDNVERYFNSLQFIEEHKNDNPKRYLALNLENDKTIEFRFFRGTLNFNTFMASIELINNLVNACINFENVEGINWGTLTKGEYVQEYVNNRGITTDRLVINDLSYTRFLNFEKDKTRILNNYILKFRNNLIDCLKNTNIKTKKENGLELNYYSKLVSVISDFNMSFERILKTNYDLKSKLYNYTAIIETLRYYIDTIQFIEDINKLVKNAKKYLEQFDIEFKEGE